MDINNLGTVEVTLAANPIDAVFNCLHGDKINIFISVRFQAHFLF